MKKLILISFMVAFISCSDQKKQNEKIIKDLNLVYKDYTPNGNEIVISRTNYFNKLKGFWLAQCIANWTGLITEMDKTGNIGKVKTGAFYTREDWGGEDQPAFWQQKEEISRTIDFVFEGSDGI